jgi:hypothetical protein
VFECGGTELVRPHSCPPAASWWLAGPIPPNPPSCCLTLAARFVGFGTVSVRRDQGEQKGRDVSGVATQSALSAARLRSSRQPPSGRQQQRHRQPLKAGDQRPRVCGGLRCRVRSACALACMERQASAAGERDGGGAIHTVHSCIGSCCVQAHDGRHTDSLLLATTLRFPRLSGHCFSPRITSHVPIPFKPCTAKGSWVTDPDAAAPLGSTASLSNLALADIADV